MKGFKSFASETQVLFINGMNSIVGPNGSGKSNIADAICFVLGRLSIKSLRADKTTNLIFAGTKIHKPASQASVELIFDNSDKKFSIDAKEITIERIVRANGQGIYKINQETKTRQEVLELLAQAGIDPYGFNIVLQGEISDLVKMAAEERRKIIEEVAGISIYELRKEKSLRELEKTDLKLKEVSSILRERTSYLKNLEEERKQAFKFKKLQEDEEKHKASILKRKLDEKLKELSGLQERFSKKEKEKQDAFKKENKIQEQISSLQEEVNKISSFIQKSSGIEQTSLNNKISDIRAEIAVLEVRKENIQAKAQETELRKQKAELEISSIKLELDKLRKEFPSQAKKSQELEKKKLELENIEKQRKNLLNLKEKANSLKEILADKLKQKQKAEDESSFILKEISRIAEQLGFNSAEECKKELISLDSEIKKNAREIEEHELKLKQQEKLVISSETEISSYEKIKKQVSSLDICPLCKSKITQEHLTQVYSECDEKIIFYQNQLRSVDKNLKDEIKKMIEINSSLRNNKVKAEIDLVKLGNVEEKKEQIKRLGAEKSTIALQVLNLEKEKKSIDLKLDDLGEIESRYDKLFFELREISSRTQENLNSEVEFKERELENIKMGIKENSRTISNLDEELKDVESQEGEKSKELDVLENESLELEKRYQKLLEKKSSLESDTHKLNSGLFEIKTQISGIENEINNLKIENARLDAEKENLDLDFTQYSQVEIISGSIFALEARLKEIQVSLASIGSVNLRALEVYENMKKEYDSIAEKVTVLENEKLEILKIIEEIDHKKRKTFIKTLDSINELFNRNFMELSVKGQVNLELENKEDPFAAGLDITVKVGKGKYFDVTSLSGGEQTLVALSLIFAIQEYKPYSFYIFDEVDAALDKRNSEKLALLIKRYMKTGQYIIVTHNDAIITESSVLYGVTMQDGISKIISLEI